jgi:hypothetical protein
MTISEKLYELTKCKRISWAQYIWKGFDGDPYYAGVYVERPCPNIYIVTDTEQLGLGDFEITLIKNNWGSYQLYVGKQKFSESWWRKDTLYNIWETIKEQEKAQRDNIVEVEAMDEHERLATLMALEC